MSDRLQYAASTLKARLAWSAESRAKRKIAHNRSIAASCLPTEVLVMCFAFLDFREVVCVSLVCSAWRSTALAFPELWRHIRLVDGCNRRKWPLKNNRPDLDQLLALSLARARQHPVDLEISSNLPPAVVEHILDEHMHHLKSLSWTAAPLPVTLVRPAPLLESLICHNVEPLSPDLFGASPGRLHTLGLHGPFFLPYSCPAIANVTTLVASVWIIDNVDADSLHRLFDLMPRLASLTLFHVSPLACVCLPSGPAPRSLERVCLSVGRVPCDVVTLVAAWQTGRAAFKDISFVLGLDACGTRDFRLLFDGAAELSVDLTPAAVRVLVTTTRGHTRDLALLHADGAVDRAAPHMLVRLLERNAALLGAVHTLRAPATLLTEPLLRAMPALASLCAVVPKWATAGRALRRVVHFPYGALERVHAAPPLARLVVRVDLAHGAPDATLDDWDAVVYALREYLDVGPRVGRERPPLELELTRPEARRRRGVRFCRFPW